MTIFGCIPLGVGSKKTRKSDRKSWCDLFVGIDRDMLTVPVPGLSVRASVGGPSEDVLLNVECPTWLGDVLRSVERTVVRTAFERSERWFGKRVSVTEAIDMFQSSLVDSSSKTCLRIAVKDVLAEAVGESRPAASIVVKHGAGNAVVRVAAGRDGSTVPPSAAPQAADMATAAVRCPRPLWDSAMAEMLSKRGNREPEVNVERTDFDALVDVTLTVEGVVLGDGCFSLPINVTKVRLLSLAPVSGSVSTEEWPANDETRSPVDSHGSEQLPVSDGPASIESPRDGPAGCNSCLPLLCASRRDTAPLPRYKIASASQSPESPGGRRPSALTLAARSPNGVTADKQGLGAPHAVQGAPATPLESRAVPLDESLQGHPIHVSVGSESLGQTADGCVPEDAASLVELGGDDLIDSDSRDYMLAIHGMQDARACFQWPSRGASEASTGQAGTEADHGPALQLREGRLWASRGRIKMINPANISNVVVGSKAPVILTDWHSATSSISSHSTLSGTGADHAPSKDIGASPAESADDTANAGSDEAVLWAVRSHLVGLTSPKDSEGLDPAGAAADGTAAHLQAGHRAVLRLLERFRSSDVAVGGDRLAGGGDGDVAAGHGMDQRRWSDLDYGRSEGPDLAIDDARGPLGRSAALRKVRADLQALLKFKGPIGGSLSSTYEREWRRRSTDGSSIGFESEGWLDLPLSLASHPLGEGYPDGPQSLAWSGSLALNGGQAHGALLPCSLSWFEAPHAQWLVPHPDGLSGSRAAPTPPPPPRGKAASPGRPMARSSDRGHSGDLSSARSAGRGHSLGIPQRGRTGSAPAALAASDEGGTPGLCNVDPACQWDGCGNPGCESGREGPCRSPPASIGDGGMGSNADGTARALEGTQDSEETREEAPGGSLCGSSNTTGSLSEVVVEDGVGCQVSPSSQQAPSDDSALQSEELLAHGVSAGEGGLAGSHDGDGPLAASLRSWSHPSRPCPRPVGDLQAIPEHGPLDCGSFAFRGGTIPSAAAPVDKAHGSGPPRPGGPLRPAMERRESGILLDDGSPTTPWQSLAGQQGGTHCDELTAREAVALYCRALGVAVDMVGEDHLGALLLQAAREGAHGLRVECLARLSAHLSSRSVWSAARAARELGEAELWEECVRLLGADAAACWAEGPHCVAAMRACPETVQLLMAEACRLCKSPSDGL